MNIKTAGIEYAKWEESSDIAGLRWSDENLVAGWVEAQEQSLIDAARAWAMLTSPGFPFFV